MLSHILHINILGKDTELEATDLNEAMQKRSIWHAVMID